MAPRQNKASLTKQLREKERTVFVVQLSLMAPVQLGRVYQIPSHVDDDTRTVRRRRPPVVLTAQMKSRRFHLFSLPLFTCLPASMSRRQRIGLPQSQHRTNVFSVVGQSFLRKRYRCTPRAGLPHRLFITPQFHFCFSLPLRSRCLFRRRLRLLHTHTHRHRNDGGLFFSGSSSVVLAFFGPQIKGLVKADM